MRSRDDLKRRAIQRAENTDKRIDYRVAGHCFFFDQGEVKSTGTAANRLISKSESRRSKRSTRPSLKRRRRAKRSRWKQSTRSSTGSCKH
jgi:hypothetical protein